MITWYFIIGAIYTISLLISLKLGYILHTNDHKSKKALEEMIQLAKTIPPNIMDVSIFISCIVSGLLWIILIPRMIIVGAIYGWTLYKFRD
jgi:ABC-type anion transport system duplicated permease subunit